MSLSTHRADPGAVPAPASASAVTAAGEGGRTAVGAVAVVLLVVGGLAYTNWVLQFVLPVRADVSTSFISELSATGQPFADLFRSADLLGGVLLAAGGAAAWWSARVHRAVWTAVIALGLAVVWESAAPLRAAMTFGESVSTGGAASWFARATDMHGIASLADTLSFLALLALGLRAMHRTQVPARVRGALAGVGVLAAVLGVAQMGQTVLFLVAGDTDALGVVQRTQITLIGLWVAAVPALLLVRARRARH
ncbi:DUF998 domain-containing protein [Nocardioides sp.]|uniref:DUF998 domain-containing protein n=1 Tax=Nocardioides sp. TaxID=35761 RepID=UPI003516A2E9